MGNIHEVSCGEMLIFLGQLIILELFLQLMFPHSQLLYLTAFWLYILLQMICIFFVWFGQNLNELANACEINDLVALLSNRIFAPVH